MWTCPSPVTAALWTARNHEVEEVKQERVKIQSEKGSAAAAAQTKQDGEETLQEQR